jgi:hypothetical protein
MTSKQCVKCNEVKPLDKFHWKNKTRDSSPNSRRNECKSCVNIVKKNRRRNIAAWLKQYKRNCECQKCGYSKETHKHFTCKALEFHHHNNDKSFDVGDYLMMGVSIDTIQKEIDKCIVLCSRCHKEVHEHEIRIK